MDPVPLEDHRHGTRHAVVERHLPDEDPRRDLHLSLDDLETDVHDSRRAAGHLFVFGKERRSHELLIDFLRIRDIEVHDLRIGGNRPAFAEGTGRRLRTSGHDKQSAHQR